ncbi:hypothetical protein B0H16DRAFT_387554 [Mycena metata]|uniref:Uncharacterized protein n=1 Tax=Mycena metata TaxID=1033252 RepID=A0AAD7NKZ4_9AGAR|nr:hypothetical protein B0H16DRAFT_387554 [Mycena metata]
MADPDLSSACLETCPQELIDLILENTDSADKDTLKSCALVASLLRPASQKLIFSAVTMLPPGRDSVLALQRLTDVLLTSPHLALHVRTLHLIQPSLNQTCAWMDSDILPALLSAFTNLESLHIQIHNLEYWHPKCEQAIHALMARSSLSSIELQNVRFLTKESCLSFLRCLPASLRSASFLDIIDGHYGSDSSSAPVELHRLHLTSLHLDTGYTPVLLDWVIRAVDPKCIRHLRTTVDANVARYVQRLLDGAIHIESYDVAIAGGLYLEETPNLEQIQSLRTLEVSVELEWYALEAAMRGDPLDNPLDNAMYTIGTASPSLEHLVLNLGVQGVIKITTILSCFMGSAALENLGEGFPALRDVVVRLTSEAGALELATGFIESVFRGLHKRGILKVIIVPTEEEEEDEDSFSDESCP